MDTKEFASAATESFMGHETLTPAQVATYEKLAPETIESVLALNLQDATGVRGGIPSGPLAKELTEAITATGCVKGHIWLKGLVGYALQVQDETAGE